MPAEFSRHQRVAQQVHRDLSLLLRERVKDPRVAMITLMDVTVSRDLSYARVFYTTFSEADAPKAQVGLDRATGFLRRELGRNLRLRLTPQLRFIYDDTQQRGGKLSTLIDQAIAEDEANKEKQ